MSSVGLNEIVGRAAINDNFREGLLNGRRAECLRQLRSPLDAAEHDAVMAIEAAGMVEFSIAIQRLIAQGDGQFAGQPVEAAVSQPVRWPNRVANNAFILHE
jgi:hypothetical protein